MSLWKLVIPSDAGVAVLTQVLNEMNQQIPQNQKDQIDQTMPTVSSFLVFQPDADPNNGADL